MIIELQFIYYITRKHSSSKRVHCNLRKLSINCLQNNQQANATSPQTLKPCMKPCYVDMLSHHPYTHVETLNTHISSTHFTMCFHNRLYNQWDRMQCFLLEVKSKVQIGSVQGYTTQSHTNVQINYHSNHELHTTQLNGWNYKHHLPSSAWLNKHILLWCRNGYRNVTLSQEKRDWILSCNA